MPNIRAFLISQIFNFFSYYIIKKFLTGGIVPASLNIEVFNGTFEPFRQYIYTIQI